MTFLFLSLRVVHVLVAAVWVGSAAFLTFVLMPAIATTGPAGGQVMVALNRKGIVPFFASISGITVVTGFYLYWRYTAGFDPELSASNAGMAYGVGGLAGVLAMIIGVSVVGRSSKRMVAVMQEVARLPDGSEKQSYLSEAATLRGRLMTFGPIVVVLQLIAAGLMAVGHYI
jgi:uncharacterized membrane protein